MEIDPAAYDSVLRDAFASHYRDNADPWTADPQMRVFPALIQGCLKLPPGSHWLDIGCGSGADVEYFAGFCQSATGIDIHPHGRWIDIAQRRSNAAFHCTDVLSYEEERNFNLVI